MLLAKLLAVVFFIDYSFVYWKILRQKWWGEGGGGMRVRCFIDEGGRYDVSWMGGEGGEGK